MTSFSLTRREFVLTAAAAAALGLPAADAEKPILRIGATTDDHLHPKRPETHRRAKACFELFRKMNADIVVDTGDIADKSQLSELAFFRKCFDEAFAGTDCVPFFCIANHDYNYLPGTKRNDPRNFENASRALGMSSVNPTAVVKGYRFVNVHQCEPDRKAFARAVEKAVAENEGNRPVFVVNHVPPMLTTTGTIHWSSQAVRDVLNRYPQVVALTGHIHTAINWAANIWQGEFTSINLGAHAEYSNKIDGEAVVLDVFADRIDVRRYEAVSGREIGADDRWSIPLPLDPQHGPYRTELRAKTCPVPALPEDATVRFEQSESGERGSLVFAAAAPARSARTYRIALESQGADGKWSFLATLDWQAPQVMDEPKKWTCPLAPALLDGGRPHRVTVTPLNSHEVAGPKRTFSLDVPANPMEKLEGALTQVVRCQRSSEPGKGGFKPEADGWFAKTGGVVALVLPKAFAAAIAARKTVTLVFDIASEQPGRPNTFSIGKFPAAGGGIELGLGSRVYTLPGNFAKHRYAWTVGKGTNPSPEDEYCLVIREGDDARFRVNGVTCFVR